jgi:hypothetical protein
MVLPSGSRMLVSRCLQKSAGGGSLMLDRYCAGCKEKPRRDGRGVLADDRSNGAAGGMKDGWGRADSAAPPV